MSNEKIAIIHAILTESWKLYCINRRKEELNLIHRRHGKVGYQEKVFAHVSMLFLLLREGYMEE